MKGCLAGANATPSPIGELQSGARAVVALGFTALKFDPFPSPWRTFMDRRQEEAAIANVAAVREAVGPDVEILVEFHRRLAPRQVAARTASRSIASRRPPTSSRYFGSAMATKMAIYDGVIFSVSDRRSSTVNPSSTT
jgi:hypothetical protein